MLLQTNKKILVYIFFFILLATLNNKNFLQFELNGINQIKIYGLNDSESMKLKEKLNLILNENIFFLKKSEIQKHLDTMYIIDSYSIMKRYPSALEIKIDKTNILANVFSKDSLFFLGSNGKLIKTESQRNGLLNIFGEFNKDSFFVLLDIFDDSKFDLSEIKNLYFFKSGRWDIETNSGILIKLPKNDLKDKLNLSFELLKKNKIDTIKILDLRQNNQVIINEK